MFFPIMKYIIFNKPDIIFSAEDHLNAVVSLACVFTFSKTKISVSSRVTPIDTYRNSEVFFSKGWFLKLLFPLVNWRADVMTCVSKDMVKQYKKIFKNTKQVPVYNIVKTDEAYIKMKEKINHKWYKTNKNNLIIASGNLAKWKGFDDLIKAFAILIKKKINLKLVIIGDGAERKSLKKLIKIKNLSKKILILRPVMNTLKYFHNSDIFVLSSRVEGMPNVMIEAMMCGCTVVATNCPTGPKEIINQNKFGYLSKVNNPKDLARNILKAVNRKIHSKKVKKIINKFSEREVLKRHFRLLKINSELWKI